MPKFYDLKGMKFGMLTVIEHGKYTKGKDTMWICKCDCGNIKQMRSYSLRKRNVKSCGCEQLKSITKHGMCKDRIYSIWEGMKARCLNKNNTSYKNYGGRNINICREWMLFSNFKNDMYDSYVDHVNEFGEKNTTIDRINNNEDYCKDNCKWSTILEQNNNKRSSGRKRYFKAIFKNGNILYLDNQKKFAENYSLNKSLLNRCLNGGRKTHKDIRFEYISKEEYYEKVL